jgi:basic amino acid/polyamine antiporter, APA family
MFKRTLSTFDATMVVAGSMIGSGIFIVSADIARTVGSPGLLLLVWLVTGVMTLFAALSCGELAGMMPEAGGQYIYIREAFGPLPGFVFGWTQFAVIQTGTIAAVAMAFAKFTSVLFPVFASSNVLIDLGLTEISTAHILAIGSLLVLTYLNAGGVSLGRVVQNLFTSTKVLAVVGLAVVGIIIGVNTEAFVMNTSALFTSIPAPSHEALTVSLFATAMVGSLFSSDAWNNITFIAGEVKDPRRSIPRGLFFGVLIVSVLYFATNIAYISLLPLQGAEGGATVLERGMMYPVDERVGTAAAEVMFGAAGATIMAVLIMISTFGCNNGLTLAGARAYWAMAQDKLFFKGAGELNKNRVPGKALWIQFVWASLLCLSGSYGDLLDYVVLGVIIFYSVTILGIFRLRRTRPHVERPYKAFGYPVIPALYIAAAAFIGVSLLIHKPQYTWPGLVIIATGIPIYYIWRRVNRTT